MYNNNNNRFYLHRITLVHVLFRLIRVESIIVESKVFDCYCCELQGP